jgi:hypothetical protein
MKLRGNNPNTSDKDIGEFIVDRNRYIQEKDQCDLETTSDT